MGSGAEGRPFDRARSTRWSGRPRPTSPIRTALLEARYVWGDTALYDEAARRFKAEVQADTARAFIAEKLAERDARHKQMGDSRYVVEPNVKEGKGGLRDLHTLFWIGKYAYNVRYAAELVEAGLADDAPNIASSTAPRISCGRCAAICTASPAAPRTG